MKRQDLPWKELELEIEKQDSKWGQQDHDTVSWLAILSEEHGEVAKEVIDFHFCYDPKDENRTVTREDQVKRIENIRKELIQTAAVALQFVASIDRQRL